MPEYRYNWLKHLDFIILDALTVEIAYIIAMLWRLEISQVRQAEIYQSTAVLVFLFAIVLDIVFPFLRNVVKRSFAKELRLCIEYTLLILAALMFYQYMLQLGTSFSRKIFVVFGIVLSVLLVLIHTIYKKILRNRFSKSKRLSKMLIISDYETILQNVQQMKRHAENSYEIVGVTVPQKDLDKIDQEKVEDIPIIARDNNLFGYLQEQVVDEVLVAVSDKQTENRLISELLLMGLVIHVNVTIGTDELPNQHIEMIGNRMVITAAVRPFSHGQAMAKRLLDIIGGLVGLIFTGIFFVIFAPIIYIQSPGPIFYSQIRIGLNGRRFRMYKFRSMYPDADKRKKELMEQNKMDGFMFKMDNDPRIIPIGRFIRKFSVDEFPQFWNVFKGDMSLVGTRPPTEDEWEQYSPEHRARLGMKPGITGLWQVSGRSDITDFDEVVALDVKYIREWNFANDIKILLKTVKVVVSGEGSE